MARFQFPFKNRKICNSLRFSLPLINNEGSNFYPLILLIIILTLYIVWVTACSIDRKPCTANYATNLVGTSIGVPLVTSAMYIRHGNGSEINMALRTANRLAPPLRIYVSRQLSQRPAIASVDSRLSLIDWTTSYANMLNHSSIKAWTDSDSRILKLLGSKLSLWISSKF